MSGWRMVLDISNSSIARRVFDKFKFEPVDNITTYYIKQFVEYAFPEQIYNVSIENGALKITVEFTSEEEAIIFKLTYL